MTANKEQIKGIIDSFNLPDFSKATIREIVGIGKKIEAETGMRMARMEMGVPGVPASEIGVNAEIEALKRGVASVYPTLEGEKALKEESSRFIKAFIGVDVAPECCVPAVGSMNGVFAAFTVCGQCDPKKDTVTVSGKKVVAVKQKYYIMLNKPRGYVTTMSDELGRKCVAELVQDVGATVYPVGRLDRDSEGLLLLTNDGEFANAVMHPRKHVPKTYRVTVRSNINDAQVEKLEGGIDIDDDGRNTLPAQVRIIEKSAARSN
jgi:hypothetical protein